MNNFTNTLNNLKLNYGGRLLLATMQGSSGQVEGRGWRRLDSNNLRLRAVRENSSGRVGRRARDEEQKRISPMYEKIRAGAVGRRARQQ